MTSAEKITLVITAGALCVVALITVEVPGLDVLTAFAAITATVYATKKA